MVTPRQYPLAYGVDDAPGSSAPPPLGWLPPDVCVGRDAPVVRVCVGRAWVGRADVVARVGLALG